MILDDLNLSAKHREYLVREKGFSDATIARNLYRTAPTVEDGAAILTRGFLDEDFRGVPGIYRNGAGRWELEVRAGELLIPVRDPRNRIAAILRRTGVPDAKYVWMSAAAKGASAGTPPHFAQPDRAAVTGEAIITEGVLKADVVAERLNAFVIGIAGVGTFRDSFGTELRQTFPDLGHVIVAYDADRWRNQHVGAALNRLVLNLRRAGLRADVAAWEEAVGKGLDDVLLGGVA